MKFVIAGTGRSGTKWAAAALRSAGWLCGHEQVFTTDMLPSPDPHAPIPPALFNPIDDPWEFDGDSSLAAVPYLDRIEARKVLLIRHPLDVIASLLAVGPLLAGSQPERLTDYLRMAHPEVMQADSEPDAAALYWTEWNLTAVGHCDDWLKLEHATVDGLCAAAGVEPRWPTFPMQPVNRGPQDVKVRLGFLSSRVRRRLVEVAGRFGYAL